MHIEFLSPGVYVKGELVKGHITLEELIELMRWAVNHEAEIFAKLREMQERENADSRQGD